MTHEEARQLSALLDQAHADACRRGLPFSVRERFLSAALVVEQVAEDGPGKPLPEIEAHAAIYADGTFAFGQRFEDADSFHGGRVPVGIVRLTPFAWADQ